MPDVSTPDDVLCLHVRPVVRVVGAARRPRGASVPLLVLCSVPCAMRRNSWALSQSWAALWPCALDATPLGLCRRRTVGGRRLGAPVALLLQRVLRVRAL